MVLMTDANGKEIERLWGFRSKNPEKYREKIEKFHKGEGTIYSLLEKYENNPGDMNLAYRTAKRYYHRLEMEHSKEIFQKITEQPEKARKIEVSTIFSEDGKDIVNLYEYARYQSVSDVYRSRDPKGLLDFLKDFPESRFAEQAYSTLGYFYTYYGDKEEGKKIFTEAVKKYPDAIDIADWYVRFALRHKESIDEAIKAGERFTHRYDLTMPAIFNSNYARLLALNGDGEKIKEVFSASHTERLLQSFAYYLYSYSNFWANRKENLEDALNMVELAEEVQPGLYNYKSVMAKLYINMGRDNEAFEVYGEDYIQNFLDNASTLNSYAWFWALEGKNLESAGKASQKSIELNPKNHNYWDTLAMIHWKMKKYKKAIEAQEKAIELYPQNQGYKERLEKIKADMKNNQ